MLLQIGPCIRLATLGALSEADYTNECLAPIHRHSTLSSVILLPHAIVGIMHCPPNHDIILDPRNLQRSILHIQLSCPIKTTAVTHVPILLDN